MRQVLSLSLSQKITKDIKKTAKIRGFDTVSGYVKYLFDLDKDLISMQRTGKYNIRQLIDVNVLGYFDFRSNFF
jgi:hypothetical protein